MNTFKMRQKGFSLLELMIVVAVIAILASIALPSYSDYVTKSSLAEASSGLADLRAKTEQYFQDNRTYVGADGTACAPVTGSNFNFACSGLSATAYLITATGKNKAAGFTFTVNQANVRATTAAKSGWSTNAACWVTSKSGAC